MLTPAGRTTTIEGDSGFTRLRNPADRFPIDPPGPRPSPWTQAGSAFYALAGLAPGTYLVQWLQDGRRQQGALRIRR